MSDSDSNDSLTDSELNAMRERCAAATPGPWTAYVEGRDHSSGSSFIMRGSREARSEDMELSDATIADYDFIAHARQDVPRLIGELERLRKIIASRG